MLFLKLPAMRSAISSPSDSGPEPSWDAGSGRGPVSIMGLDRPGELNSVKCTLLLPSLMSTRDPLLSTQDVGFLPCRSCGKSSSIVNRDGSRSPKRRAPTLQCLLSSDRK